MASLQSKILKFAPINAAGSGNNTLVAAIASKRIRVHSLWMVATGAVAATFQTGAGGTALSGAMSLAANGGLVLPYNEKGWFETSIGQLLNLSLGGAVQVSGGLGYSVLPS